MNKLWSEIKELFQLGPLNLLRQYKLLSEELILIKKSSKCIIVQPTVEVKGLSKLKRALMLQGDNMIIQNNKINMVASKKDMACIYFVDANKTVVNNCQFKVAKKEGNK